MGAGLPNLAPPMALDYMGIYTLDQRSLARQILKPTEALMSSLVAGAGNEGFSLLGHNSVGLPIIECNNIPLDSDLYGVKWIPASPEA